MAQTIIGLGDPKAIKRWSSSLAVDVARKSYFSKKFMGKGADASTPIQLFNELENDAGDQITFDLSMQIAMQPIEGDDVLEGKEEDLKFYSDNFYIDQMRCGVNTGGKMTRKRTLHNLRAIARKRQSEWWARVQDEIIFMYLSGSRGINPDFVFPLTYTGFANNAFTAPDTNHIMYPTGATSKATIAATHKMDLTIIDKLVAHATMMGGGTQQIPQIQPIDVNGEKHYVLLMNPWQMHDLRTNTNAGQWLDIQKAATAAEGRSNPIFKGAAGMYNNVLLHEHKAVIRYDDYGAGSNVEAARALFLGAQAGAMAFGSPGTGMRFQWHEETRDNGNQVVISTAAIWGAKKCTFNSNDFGVIAVDTAAAQPA